jgi:preprotein translocase subunit SecD
MRSIWLVVGMMMVLSLPAEAGHSGPKIIMRVYIQTNEGLPATEAQPIAIPPDNEVIDVRTLPEVTEGDLVDVETDPAGSVHLHFDHSGQVNLDVVTAQNQGRILVLMIDGIIVYAPIIDEQISNGELVIPHHLNPEIVQLLQEVARKNVEETKRT